MFKYVSLAAVTLVAAGAALALFSSSKLDQFVSKLQDAEALDVQFTVMQVGGAPTTVNMSMQKPDRLRIETDSRLIVADGTHIINLDKSRNRYTKVEQTKEELNALFSGPDTAIWSAFFNADAFKGVASARDAGSQRRGSATYDLVTVQIDSNGNRSVDLYLDQETGLVRIAEIKEQSPQGTVSTIINANKVNNEVASNLFAFVAPSGAEEVKPSDLVAGKWHTNFDEALALAKEHNKLMLVGFSAVWCGPCQMLERQVYPDPVWQEAAKDFILVKIDVDQQPSVAQRYQVSAMPTIHFIRPDGSVAHTMMGFRPTAQYISEMETARGKF